MGHLLALVDCLCQVSEDNSAPGKQPSRLCWSSGFQPELCREMAASAGKMPAFRDRPEACPPIITRHPGQSSFSNILLSCI